MTTRVVPEGLRAFLATEAGSTFVLLAATAAGLIWANSPFGHTYETFWATDLSLRFGSAQLTLDLHDWVNDGLMTLFFFVIGLEISREVTIGQLNDRRLIAVPVSAALGGMLLPALTYALVNRGGPGAGAWGIPMASDTAFVLGLLAVIGARCAEPLRGYLLTLAVVDDIGAITVVALFYGRALSVPALLTVLGLLVLLVALRWLHGWRAPAYMLLGLAMWVAALHSGVHPTLVGIILGALVTVYAPGETHVLRAGELASAFTREPSAERAHAASLGVRQAVSVNERLQFLLHPWTSYVIVPLFALANAGVRLDAQTLGHAASSRITLGIVLGLVLGKFVGISLGTWLSLRLDLGELPGNLVWGQVLGGAAVAGIGFTVSLFITDLAFPDPARQSDAKIGIIIGSLIAAALGWVIFRLVWNRGEVCAPPASEATGPVADTDSLADPIGERDHTRGPVDAPVTLVEYGDYECPFCGRAFQALEELRERYGDRLRFAFRHFPLREVHPHAMAAAIVAEAAADRGRFWEMHSLLFGNQLALTDRDLSRYAAELDVEPWTYVTRHRRRIAIDIDSGLRSGVGGTPTFYLNGVRYEGEHTLDAFSAAVEEALNMGGS